MNNNYIVTLSDEEKNTIKNEKIFEKNLVFKNGTEVELVVKKTGEETICETALYINFCKVYISIERGDSALKNKVIKFFDETYCVIVA